MARNLNIVMIPFPAFGHLVPFIHLAMALAKSGVQVSIISTPKNIKRVPKPPPNLSSPFHFVVFPLPEVAEDGRSLSLDGAESAMDVPSEKLADLSMAYQMLKKPVKELIMGSDPLPDWIIVDLLVHWGADIATELRVPLLVFSVLSASTSTFFGSPEHMLDKGPIKFRATPESLRSKPEWVDFPSSVSFTNQHEALVNYKALYGQNKNGISIIERFAKTIQSSEAVAIRSCYEYEGNYLNLFQRLIRKPVVPVGLLPPEPQQRQSIGDSWVEIFKWLDDQKPKSIVFVGFGSQCKLNREQVYEIAHGVELSELPFLLILRKPEWAIDDLDALPPEFHNRTSGKGMVIIGWAPQLEILSHPSIGGSLFHSGWGSVIESLQFGHYLVLLPFIFDQGLNARLLVEKGLAVEVERSDDDGSFKREDLAKSLKHVMLSEDGELLRAKVKEASLLFGDRKLHLDHYISGFVEFLKNKLVEQ